MYKIYLFFFLLITNASSFAQPVSDDYLSLVQDSLRPLSKVILDIRKAEEERLSANIKFKRILKTCLEKEGAQNFVFDSVNAIARLEPEDKSFVIFNWELPHADGTFTYFAFVISKNKKTKTV